MTAAALVVAGLALPAAPAQAVSLTPITDVGLPGASQAVVVSPDKSTVYATSINNNSLSVIDAATNTLSAVIPVGLTALGVTITPNGAKVYVNNSNAHTVSVVDTATRTVIKTIPVGNNPIRLAASPDGTSVFVANTGSNSVSRIATATDTVVATIGVGSLPRSIAFSPDGSKAYVTNRVSNSVSVIDTATNTVTASIGVGSAPEPIAISPDGARVYTANVTGNSVSVINTATNTVTASIGVGANPYDLAAGPDGNHLYVTHTGETNLKVIDLTTNAVSTVALDGDGRGVAINADGTRLYVTYAQNRVRVFGLTSVPAPTVTAVSPASGPASGGTVVTVTGTNLTGASISFGGTAATGVSCTATSCTATAPAGTGTVHVRATTAAGTSPTSPADQYTYASAPTITAVTPNSGPPAGGNTVTITGTDLTGAAISFGGTAATGVSCTATSCTVTAPAGSAGTVHVRATTAGGTSPNSPANQYTYAAADLAVGLTATGVPGVVGRIDYVVTVTNNGPAPLASATIVAALPSPMAATSSDCTVSGSIVNCGLGALASGASTTRRFSAPVGLLSIGLPYSVTTSRVASSPVDTNPNNDSATRNCTVITPLIISCS